MLGPLRAPARSSRWFRVRTTCLCCCWNARCDDPAVPLCDLRRRRRPAPAARPPAGRRGGVVRARQPGEADLSTPLATAAANEPRSTLISYAGEYYPASARFRIAQWQSGAAPKAKISVSDDGLVFTRRTRRVRLIPLGSGKFRRPTDPVATVIFAKDASGTLYLQGELGNFVKTEQCPGFIAACDS